MSFSLWDEDDEDECAGHTLSAEQLAVVHTVADKKNTKVIAKAGTGKTTTSLSVAREFHKRHKQKTLLLTYNSSLKDETRTRIQKQGLKYCMEAHSYHAAAYKFFPADSECGGADDGLIRNAIDHPAKMPLSFGLVIIDEAQDMTGLYCLFVQHLLKQFATPPVMLLLGDPFQQIFRYAGADIQYLTEPHRFFSDYIHPSPFTQCHLTISYRITHEMADFINQHLNPVNLRFALRDEVWQEKAPFIESWWGEGIRANPERPPAPDSVVYQEVNFFNSAEFQNEIEKVTRECETLPGGREQLAILLKQMSGKAPINQVVERMSRQSHENCIILRGDAHHDLSGQTKSQVMQKKLTISTIHKFKGLERDVVVICGLDQYYEQGQSDRNFLEHLDLYNAFYVACTRGKSKLIIWKTKGKLDYVTKRKCRSGQLHQAVTYLCRVKDLFSYVPFDDVLSRTGHGLSVSALPSPEAVERIEFDADDRLIDGRCVGTKEDVSPILGVLIELLVLQECKRQFPQYAYAEVLNAFQDSRESADEVGLFLAEFYTKPGHTLEDLARFAVAKFAIDSGFIHVWRQIDGAAFCNWLKTHQSIVEGCVSNVQVMLAQLLGAPCDWNVLSPRIQFFKNVAMDFTFAWFQTRYEPCIVGQIDMLLDNDILVELKVTSGLQMDHILQAQLYSSLLWKTQLTVPKKTVTPIVMIANLGEMHRVDLTLAPSVETVSSHFELLYRAAKRRMLQSFRAEDMVKDLAHHTGDGRRKKKRRKV